VDFHKVIFIHELPVDLAETGLEAEYSLVSWNTKINDTVVKTHILTHNRHGGSVFLFLFISWNSCFHFCLLIENLSACIFDLERKIRNRFVYAPNFFYRKLNLLGTSCNSLLGYHDIGNNLND